MTAFLCRLERIVSLSPTERQAILDLPICLQTLAPKSSMDGSRDGAAYCCLILKGYLYSYQLLKDERKQIIGFHVPGDIPDLDRLHLLRNGGDGLTATVETTVLLIRYSDLRDLITAFPRLADAFWRFMLLDAAVTRNWLVSVGRRPALERIAYFFCEFYSRLETVGLAASRKCEMPFSQRNIGNLLNMSDVHVNRTLKALRSFGLITLSRRNLVIKDWNKLIEIAGFDPAYLHLRSMI